MNTLVVYDSNYGNTKKIAEAIARECGEGSKAVLVSDFSIKELEGMEVLVVGSPINGWRPTSKIGEFLAYLDQGQLKRMKAAAFDTRIKVWYSGDAAKKIKKLLEKAGAKIMIKPEPFYVKDKEGPLVDGEIEHAQAWAHHLKKVYENKRRVAC